MMRKVGVVLAIGMMAVPVTGAGSALEDASESVEQTIRDPVELLLWLVGQVQCAAVEVLDEPSTQSAVELDSIAGVPTANATIPVTHTDGNVSWVRLSIQADGPDDCGMMYCIDFEPTGFDLDLQEMIQGTDFDHRPHIFVRFFSGGAAAENGDAKVGGGFWTIAISRDEAEAECDAQQASGE